MRLLREERAVEHRHLEHRDLQTRKQRLDAVGKIARLEDEIEQHRHHLDRHRFELVGALAERRFLQVAQDVVQAFRDAGERDLRAFDIEIRLPCLEPRQSLAQSRRREDRRTRHVTRRRRRQRRHRARQRRRRMAGQREAAVRRHPPEHGHHVHLRRRAAAMLRGACPRQRACAAPARRVARGVRDAPRRHDAQVRQVAIDIAVDRSDIAERRLVQFLQDLELDAVLGLEVAQRIAERADDRRGRERIASRSRGRSCRSGGRCRGSA